MAVPLLAVCLCCCDRDDPVAPTPTVVVNVNNVLNNFPPATPPATTPTPAGLGGVIIAVRTGFFGGSCPDVRNGAPLRVGCVGFATATPVGQGDIKLPPEVHGVECTWTTDRPDVVRLQQPGDNQFNVDVHAVRPGIARITANVKGVIGFFDVQVVTS